MGEDLGVNTSVCPVDFHRVFFCVFIVYRRIVRILCLSLYSVIR